MTGEQLQKHFMKWHTPIQPGEETWGYNSDEDVAWHHKEDHDSGEGQIIPHRHTPLGVVVLT